ncbi:MAG: GNAT family N-acetyltransferase [Flavobacteriales bacterium]|jgi:ElaA protein|nr:GNAT family N-acetyltransferase [Flavobacteriales bacterium]|tara:strand:+ start:2809 stop:3249 length:441 start_codon:yes stop_codon:yes gene_type:complete
MIVWTLKTYNELSIDLLYQVLKIRQEVFIIEQNCNYLDADNYDQCSSHLLGFIDGELIAYMRIVNPGNIYKHLSLGRILVKKKYRNEGVGKQLMSKAISLFAMNHTTIVLSAQYYLLNFYKEFGFEVIGDKYLEDNIPHIKMIRYG